MLKRLLWIVFVVVLLEACGIYMMQRWIGGWLTFLLLLAGAVVGALLMQSEGRKVWGEARLQLSSGQMPGHAILDGICVLAGGLLLIVPGFLSDLVGLAMLLPWTRSLFRMGLYGWLAAKVQSGTFRISGGGFRRF
ncbi:FxsA family protein [Cohnella sp. GCM10012308]|uniref:FxsA family protein n=1 Tax=Cohnella sp. GCM10012308 TaxID=3317329 RepID=UPI0036244F74